MERPGEWVTLDDARRRLLAALRPLDPRPTPLADALGRVLAEPVLAPRNVPPFAASAMDGYAVRAADVTTEKVRLSVVGSSGAGRPAEVAVKPGEAVAIATGGALPEGADAICPVEDATADGPSVTVTGPVQPGSFVRPAGSDTSAGTTVFDPDVVLGAAHIGVIAGLGIDTVTVRPTPRVGVLATGDEIVTPPQKPGPGQIYDANRPAMLAAARAVGCEVVDLGMVTDEETALEQALVAGSKRCDVILTSGGVSVGVADHAKAVLGRLAPGTVQWMEVRIKPGKPFGFGVLTATGVPVLCLPGNPVSALVVFELLVRPALFRLGGRPGGVRRAEVAVADDAFDRPADGKLHALRVVATADPEGTLRVRSAGGQDSHQLRTLAEANALALLSDGMSVAVGDQVHVLVTDPDSVDTPRDRP